MQELIEIRDKNGIKGVIAFFDNEEQMKNLKNNIDSYSNVLLDNNLIELAIEYDKKNGTQILMLLLEKYNKFFYDYKYNYYSDFEEGYYHTKAFDELFKYVKKLNTDEMNSILNTVFDYFKDKIPEEQYKYILAHTYNIDKNVIKYTMEKFDVKNNENLRLYLLNNILPKTIQCILDNKGTYDLSEHKTEKLIIQYVFETFEEDINKIITNTNKFYIYSILISDNDIFNYFINTCKDKTILKNLLSHALMFDKNINNILNLFYKLNININETLNNDNTTILMYACKNKNSNIVLALLNEYNNNIDINAVDKYGKTALMYACENCTEEVIQALINKGAKVDTKDKNGLTALEILKIRNRTLYSEIKESVLVEQQNNVSQKDNDFNEKQKVFLRTDYLETRKEHLNGLTQLGADISFAYKLSKKPELRNRVIFYKNNNKNICFDKDYINPELKQLLEKELQELKNSNNEKEVRYIRVDDGHNYTIVLSKDCVYVIDSVYRHNYRIFSILKNLTTHSDLFKDMPIYALGTQIQFDNVSCVNFTPESIFVMDKYLTNNDISLKEFITNKDNFVSNDDNYIDKENGHIITDIPKCLVHLMQRSEERIQKQYNEKIKDTVIKKKEDGTETTIEDEINKNKKVANNGKIVNGTLDYKRQKSIERVIGKKVKIITPDEMCEKLIKYKEKVAHLEKCSTRLEQLDKKLFYMNRYAYNKGQNQDILIEELDNGERIVYTAAILGCNKTRSEDLEIKTKNDKIKEFINNIKYKEFGSNTLKNIDININMYNFKNNCDFIIIFVKSLCDKILEGCEFINNKTNEEFNLLLLIEKLSEIYNIEYKELLKTFERTINDKVDSLSSDLEKNKKDYNNIYNEYDKCKKLTNNWKNWEEHNLDNLNKYRSVEKTEHEIFLYNDQFNQELNYLTQEENLLMQSEQHNQEKINLIQNQKRLIENQHHYNLNQYQKYTQEENLLMQNKQRNQEKIIQIQNQKRLIENQYHYNLNQYQKYTQEENLLMQSEQHNQEKINLIQNQKRLIENQYHYNLNQYQKYVEEENLLMQNKQRNQEKIIQIQNQKNLIKEQYNKNFIKLQQCVEEKNKLTSWYQEQIPSIYQYQQWCNHDKQEIETKLKDNGINEKLENIDKEIRKEKKIIKNIGKYKIGIIKELEKDLNSKNSVDLIYIKLKNNLIINKNIGIKIKEDEIVIDKRNMNINIKRTNSENIYDCMNNYLKNNKIKLGKTEQNIIKDVLNEICKLKVFATITR